MTQLIEKQGDLFTTTAPAIAHGVNTHGVMGAGVAKLIRARYEHVYDGYRSACLHGHLLPGGLDVEDGGDVYIYNIASQDKPGPNARLDWLTTGVRAALTHADKHDLDVIAMPRIGCGIGGLDWDDVKPVLEAAAAEFFCDIEVWTL